MSGISFSGLGSGIDFDALLDALMAYERRPIDAYYTRQSEAREDVGAVNDVKNRLSNLLSKAEVFTSNFNSVFRKTSATSSNAAVLTASAVSGAASGTYDVRVERLASTMTVISAASPSVASFTAGATGLNLDPDIEAPKTLLGSLHRRDGGAAFLDADFGLLTVDDGLTGPVAIDLTPLGQNSTVQDLLDQMNAALTLAGSGASVSLNADATGLLVSSSTGTLSIADGDGAVSATKLGIATAGAVAAPVDGGDLDPDLQADTSIAALQGGAGAALAGGLTLRLGAETAAVDLSAASTVQDVLDALNGSGLAVAATLAADGIRIDATAADRSLAVDEGTGTAAAGLGLAGLEDKVLRVKTAADADYERIFLSGTGVDAIRDAFNRPTGRSYAASVVDGRLVLNASAVGTDGALAFVDDAAAGGVLEQLDILETNPLDSSTLNTEYAGDSTQGGVVAGAADARFSVNGIVVERSKNTGITDVISGVTLDLKGASAATGAAFPADYASTTLTVANDDDSVVSAVRDLVAQYNSAIEIVKSVTRVDTEGDDDGTLLSNSLVRNLRADLESIFIDMSADVGQGVLSVFQLTTPDGDPVFSSERGGTITLNEARLREALSDDREAVEKAFALDVDGNGTLDDGLAVRLRSFLKAQVDSGGLFQAETEMLEQGIDDLDERILAYEERLDLREKTLKAQFSAAERALSQLQASSNSIANGFGSSR